MIFEAGPFPILEAQIVNTTFLTTNNE